MESIGSQISSLLSKHKANSSLPIWGEIYHLIHMGRKQNERIYQIDPYGEIIYDRTTRKYVARIPEINMIMSMKDHELVDCILYRGMFKPKSEP